MLLALLGAVALVWMATPVPALASTAPPDQATLERAEVALQEQIRTMERLRAEVSGAPADEVEGMLVRNRVMLRDMQQLRAQVRTQEQRGEMDEETAVRLQERLQVMQRTAAQHAERLAAMRGRVAEHAVPALERAMVAAQQGAQAAGRALGDVTQLRVRDRDRDMTGDQDRDRDRDRTRIHQTRPGQMGGGMRPETGTPGGMRPQQAPRTMH